MPASPPFAALRLPGRSAFAAALLAGLGAVPLGATAQAPAAAASSASAPAPARAASAPSRTPPPPTASLGGTRPRAVDSASVQDAERAQQPGRVRPRQQVVPQVAVPLRQSDRAAPGTGAGAGAGNGVDDRRARCLAATTAEERARCADAPAKPASGGS